MSESSTRQISNSDGDIIMMGVANVTVFIMSENKKYINIKK